MRFVRYNLRNGDQSQVSRPTSAGINGLGYYFAEDIDAVAAPLSAIMICGFGANRYRFAFMGGLIPISVSGFRTSS